MYSYLNMHILNTEYKLSCTEEHSKLSTNLTTEILINKGLFFLPTFNKNWLVYIIVIVLRRYILFVTPNRDSKCLNKKTYFVSSFSFSVCMLEMFCKAFSAKVCQLLRAISSFSQSEADITSGRPITVSSLETQDSINLSSDVICPWIPETAWRDLVSILSYNWL